MSKGLVDVTTLARIRDLNLIAKLVIQGGAYGLHSSRQRGAGFEFSQYRTYQPGDDLRYVDWKLFTRTDRLFVREADRESQQNVWFLCDLSESMNQPSGQISDWTRLDCAKCLIATLAHLICAQGDHFGFLGLREATPPILPDGLGQQHLQKLYRTLDQMQASGSSAGFIETPALYESIQDADVTVFVTDHFQLNQEFSSLTSKLAAAGKELVVIQLLTRDEKEFPFKGNLAFEDRETGETLEVDAGDFRQHYLTNLELELSKNASHILSLGGQFHELIIEDPLDASIWHLLKARQAPKSRRGLSS
ncbi:MAG: DUF58 domain-containing protein [Pseudomonadota bacterium]